MDVEHINRQAFKTKSSISSSSSLLSSSSYLSSPPSSPLSLSPSSFDTPSPLSLSPSSLSSSPTNYLIKLPKIINVPQWIVDNHEKFQPPVANHFMHYGSQLSVMFVGGPNNRTDYHIQQGEEFFYQLRGDALIKTMVHGKPKDIIVKEGQIFLLPKCIPHSPQRFPNTMGLVLERMRKPHEIDVLRFYVEKSDNSVPEILYQDTFHWDNVNTDMIKCLVKYCQSEECITGKPKPGATFKTPLTVNVYDSVEKPFNLIHWIISNQDEINSSGKLEIFDTKIFKHKIYVYGEGKQVHIAKEAETWLFQLVGSSEIKLPNEKVTYKLERHDTLLVPIAELFEVTQQKGSYLLSCSQNP